jgi:nucleoside-diphosphate-sugar epimerase
MRILVTGAYGFIASQITSTLTAAGHTVVCCVRDLEQAKRRFPYLEAIPCNFISDTHAEIWRPRLQNIDVVVNCVGVLQTATLKTMEAIHYKTPKALVEACIASGVKKFVHFSALGADEAVDTPYAQTKLAFEKYLHNLDYQWVILRPSLIYAPGSYGGTSLFRALAAMPFVIPVVGKGDQLFQPIHIRDLARVVKITIENPNIAQETLNVVGPDTISVENLLILLRQWLGFSEARVVHIPSSLIRLGAYFGDYFQDIPINSTSFKMLSYDNIADVKPLIATVGFEPDRLQDNLIKEPSSVQDRWHARLFFLNPLLRITLGIMWILSGLIPLLSSHDVFDSIFFQAGITGTAAVSLFYFSTLLDMLLGLLTLIKWHIKWVGALQIVLIIAYTLIISIFIPQYWLDPFGAIVKNLPLLVSTLVMMAMADPR